jgi:hypothetical protein
MSELITWPGDRIQRTGPDGNRTQARDRYEARHLRLPADAPQHDSEPDGTTTAAHSGSTDQRSGSQDLPYGPDVDRRITSNWRVRATPSDVSAGRTRSHPFSAPPGAPMPGMPTHAGHAMRSTSWSHAWSEPGWRGARPPSDDMRHKRRHGEIETLPSGSLHVRVYPGIDRSPASGTT